MIFTKNLNFYILFYYIQLFRVITASKTKKGSRKIQDFAVIRATLLLLKDKKQKAWLVFYAD